MAQFQVPQFIDTEDKIIGPFSIKQFLFLFIAGAFCGILYLILTFWLWAIIASLIMSAAFSFALIKINGRGLWPLTLSAFGYYWSPQYYIFKSRGKSRGATLTVKPGGLKDIIQNLTISKNTIPQREMALPLSLKENQKERYELVHRASGEKEMARRVDFK